MRPNAKRSCDPFMYCGLFSYSLFTMRSFSRYILKIINLQFCHQMDFQDFLCPSSECQFHSFFRAPMMKKYFKSCLITLFESENERQKIEPVPIPLPRASRNIPGGKTRSDFFFHNWTLEIIPFIRSGMQMDRTKNFFLRCQKLHFLQLSTEYNRWSTS